MVSDTPDTLQLAGALEDAVVRLAHVLLRTARPAQSRTALSVLAHLREHGPQRITELAQRESVAQPSMTALVDRLERQALVERTPDPDDRRAVRVAVTEAGLTVLAERRATRAAALAVPLDALDPSDREVLARVLPALQRLSASIEEGR
jgi:DNA-binding MarR family transcriptional regulator